MEIVVVSACLVGVKCRYDGGHRLLEKELRLWEAGQAVALCPELLAGFGAPRKPAEIVGGDGRDVLRGEAKVIDSQGKDLTARYIAAAARCRQIARIYGARRARLADGSPACGVSFIYDGTFSRTVRSGLGVTAALLRACGLALEPA